MKISKFFLGYAIVIFSVDSYSYTPEIQCPTITPARLKAFAAKGNTCATQEIDGHTWTASTNDAPGDNCNRILGVIDYSIASCDGNFPTISFSNKDFGNGFAKCTYQFAWHYKLCTYAAGDGFTIEWRQTAKDKIKSNSKSKRR